MAKKTTDFDKINRLINTRLPAVRKLATGVTAQTVFLDPGKAIPKLCEIYQLVRPILVALSAFPLIPAKWREAIKLLVQVLNQICKAK